jgi:hypothetical protein
MLTRDESYYVRRARECALAAKRAKSWDIKVGLFDLHSHYLQCIERVRRQKKPARAISRRETASKQA